jgi:hypothetical protein
MMNMRWAFALTLAILGTLAVGRVQASIYAVDFGSPPHTVGQPPVTGAGPSPRVTVSSIQNGNPVVVGSAGTLNDQPCLFSSYDGVGDQVQFDLSDLPPATFYTLEADLVMAAGDPLAELAIMFDAPTVRSLRFLGNGQILALDGGGGSFLGMYTLNQEVHVSIQVDLMADIWSITLDGTEVHNGPFGDSTALDDIRISTDVLAIPLRSLFAVDNVVISAGAGGLPCDRLTLGDLTLGTVYNVGSSFVTEGVSVQVIHFATEVGTCGPPFANGSATVDNTGMACGAGREIELSNATLNFDFGGTVSEVVIPYGEWGGTVGLMVNTDCVIAENMIDLDGTELGGVAVTVFQPGQPGQGCGVVRLGGSVSSLAIGGQEFAIDGLSYCQACPDLRRTAFDDQVLSTEFHVGDSFSSGGAQHTLFAYYWPGASCTDPQTTGVATISDAGNACGDGKELSLNNINDRIDFGTPVDWLVLNYGEYGGNVNLRINGDCRNLDNLSDINGSVVGGVTVWAIDYGPPDESCGQLYAVGTINNFRIGGQEFAIENIRVCPTATAEVIDPRAWAAGTTLRLDPARPNPVRDSAALTFTVAKPATVRMTLFDVGGREVRTLYEGPAAAGTHEVRWDGNGDPGRRLPAGVYSCRIQSGAESVARHLILLP